MQENAGSTIPLALRVREFLAAKKEWERARHERTRATIVFAAEEQLRRLDADGPDAICLPYLRKLME